MYNSKFASHNFISDNRPDGHTRNTSLTMHYKSLLLCHDVKAIVSVSDIHATSPTSVTPSSFCSCSRRRPTYGAPRCIWLPVPVLNSSLISLSVPWKPPKSESKHKQASHELWEKRGLKWWLRRALLGKNMGITRKVEGRRVVKGHYYVNFNGIWEKSFRLNFMHELSTIIFWLWCTEIVSLTMLQKK